MMRMVTRGVIRVHTITNAGFVFLTVRARLNKVCNVFVHSWPPEVSPYELDCFIHAEMAGNSRVVSGLHDG